MLLSYEQQYWRARQIADFLAQGGRTVDDVKEEFEISERTYQRAMQLLANASISKEGLKDRIRYKRAMDALHKEAQKRRNEATKNRHEQKRGD